MSRFLLLLASLFALVATSISAVCQSIPTVKDTNPCNGYEVIAGVSLRYNNIDTATENRKMLQAGFEGGEGFWWKEFGGIDVFVSIMDDGPNVTFSCANEKTAELKRLRSTIYKLIRSQSQVLKRRPAAVQDIFVFSPCRDDTRQMVLLTDLTKQEGKSVFMLISSSAD